MCYAEPRRCPRRKAGFGGSPDVTLLDYLYGSAITVIRGRNCSLIYSQVA